MLKKSIWLLLACAPMAMAGQGMFVTVNSYLPNTEIKVLKADCVDRSESIKVNHTAYIEAGFCLDNDLTLSLRQNNQELQQYRVRISFGGSSLEPRGMIYQGGKMAVATLYPHSGVTGTQDRLVISLASLEADWMKEMGPRIADKPLNTVILPGSHDSGTQGITVQSEVTSDLDPKVRNVINLDPLKMQHLSNWSISQNLSITDQLVAGIRYLDLRLCKLANGKQVTCHGVSGESMDNVINAVANFIKYHDKEIVILDINHVYDFKTYDIDMLVKQLQAKFGDKLALPANFSPLSPVKQFWGQGKQVIVSITQPYAENAWKDVFWRSRRINSPWPDKQDLNEMEKSLYEILFKRKHHGMRELFVLQTQETPSTKTIIEGFNPFGNHPDSLLRLTTFYKHGMEAWLRNANHESEMQNNGNIIIEDFTNGIDLTEYAKRLN